MLVNLGLIKFLVLVAQLMLSPLMIPVSNLAYARGDWLIYRYVVHGSILDLEVECEFIVNITIEDVKEYKVVYYASWGIVRIDKGFEICIRVPESSRYTIDVSYMAPASGEFIVDPTHSGIFDVVYRGFTGKAEYYRGILVSLSASFYNLTTEIDLINSSVPELKQFAKSSYTYTYTAAIYISRTGASPGTTPTISSSTTIDYGYDHAPVVLYIAFGVVIFVSTVVLAKVMKKTRRCQYIRKSGKKTRVYS